MDNCLKLMCDVIKVNSHPIYQDSLVVTDEFEEISTDSITGVMTDTAQLSFKEIDGQIHSLTQEVYYTVYQFLYTLL